VANNLGRIGGMERPLWHLVHGLLADGRHVTVISMTCDFPPHPNLRWIPVRVKQRPFSLGFPLFFAVASYKTWRHRRGLLHINGAIVINRADVAAVHMCVHAAFPQLGLRPSRNGPWYRLNAVLASRLSLLAERFVYRAGHVRAILAVSGGVAEEIAEHFPDLRGSIRTVPNGVDHEAFTPNPTSRAAVRVELGLQPDRLVAIFVSNEWEGKGLRFALEAIGRVPSVHLIVVGNGDRSRYEKLAASNAAVDRVHFVGPSRNPERYLAAADVFILPTAYETFSLVTYEAAACGLALLVTAVNGARDIVSDGVTGWFIRRDADSIVQRLAQLKDDRELVSRMGGCAHAAAKSFTWERMVDGYVNLYDDLVTPPRDGGAP
jgi:glycosyltransferase involved in cell wall biosynthesis